jgi:hypothetical protein
MKCRILDCHSEGNVPGTAKGLCRSHYKRLMRYGDAEAPLRKTNSWAGVKCTAPRCRKRARISGLCEAHYAAYRRSKKFLGNKRRGDEFKARALAKQESVIGRPRPLVCEVCQESGYGRGNKPNSGIVFDHCHATGRPRGWLCDRCNKMLGLSHDSPSLLRRLGEYLEANHGKTDEQKT